VRSAARYRMPAKGWISAKDSPSEAREDFSPTP
jgi:hypothetical protein